MSAFLTLTPVQRFVDGNGNALVGGKLFTYAAGTTTKQATYTDSTGLTPNTNPIILNARGECEVWLNPALAYKMVLSPSTDTDPPTNPIWTVDNVNSSSSIPNWGGTSAGSANAQTITPSPPISNYIAGQQFSFIAGYTNTGPVTLAVNGLAATPILQGSGVPLANGQIIAENVITVEYDGTNFRLIGSQPFVTVQQFGAVGDGATNDSAAFSAALAAVGPTQYVYVPYTASGYFLGSTSGLTFGNSSACCALIGIGGRPLLKFGNVGSSTDCLTFEGSGLAQMILENLIIDFNNTGRDGLVVMGSNRPIVRNVQLNNSLRDVFVLSPTDTDFIEKGQFDIGIQNAGRHGITMSLSGSGGAYVNECVWNMLEIRGVSKNTAGGLAVYMTSTATDAGSKFSNHLFLKTNFDAQYNGSGNAPSSNVVEADSGIVENFRFMAGGWENSGGTALTGYAWAYTGSGSGNAWNGLTIDSVIDNSLWGSSGVDPTIGKVWFFDYSFGKTTLSGTVQSPDNSKFYVYQSNVESNVTGDGTAYTLGTGGVTELYNSHSDTVTNGVFIAPVTGKYHFNACAFLSGLSSGHTFAQLELVMTSGSFTGRYMMASYNPFANKNSGNNGFMAGSVEVGIEEGVSAHVELTVSGSTKTVDVSGGAGDKGSCYFSGHLLT